MSDTEDLAALNDRLMAKNHALAEALSRAGKELTKAKSQLAQLAQPPLTFATMVKVDSTRTDEDGIQHASAEVISGTRRMVVPCGLQRQRRPPDRRGHRDAQREARAGRAARC